MYAVIGLGNPGQRYAQTRHNAGFWVIDRLVDEVRSGLSWKEDFGCQYLKVLLADKELLLIKPQRYMNRSGVAVDVLRYFRVGHEELVVCYDELDLTPGSLQLRRGGAAGGHRGLVDVISRLGTEDFYRIRVGIGHPRERAIEQATEGDGQAVLDVSDYVLSKPGPKEKELLDDAVFNAACAVQTLLVEGMSQAQNRFNRKL